ncbi:MAG: hypothetical protein HY287_08830 [Planctomycetes bacterium]|nr:hypothetical protein [Planctomycetota bacterium]
MKNRRLFGIIGVGLVACSFARPVYAQPCTVPDNGGGTVTLPPAGCTYLSPQNLHEILNGLPPGTTVEIGAQHAKFFNITSTPGGSLGGDHETSNSLLQLHLQGTGSLAGYDSFKNIQAQMTTDTGPRMPGMSPQSFDTDMFGLQGQITGDPDFDLLRITAGSGFGMPSPGHTTLTSIGGGNWNVDSFFDITYRIDFIGHNPGPFAGHSGSTTGTIRMQTGGPIANVPCCLPLGICVNTSSLTACQGQGGTPVAACQGDTNGDGIDEACYAGPCSECPGGQHWISSGNPPCPPGGFGQDTLPTGALVGIDLDGDGIPDVSISATGPITIAKRGPFDDSQSFPGTRPLDGVLDVIDTEMLAMSLTGGGVTIKAGTYGGSLQPLQRTLGTIAEEGSDPSKADSFFDVFVEIQNGGQLLYNQTPIRVITAVPCLPCDSTFLTITGITPLYTSPQPGTGQQQGAIVGVKHFNYPACCEPGVPLMCASNVPPAQCQGTVVPSCLGDSNGDGIDDACPGNGKCEPDPTSPSHCTNVCPPPIPPNGACLPTKIGCDPTLPGSCGVLECSCIDDTSCRLVYNAAGNPGCTGQCPVPPGGNCTLQGTGSFTDPYHCACGGIPPVCAPDASGQGCNPNTCPPGVNCAKHCAKYDPLTGQTTITDCDCVDGTNCHLETATGALERDPAGNCTVPDNAGTVTLPPAGCDYLSPQQVHDIINGLPAGTTIEFAAIHKDFICNPHQGAPTNCSFIPPPGLCDQPGGDLGGEKECRDSTNLVMNLTAVCSPMSSVCPFNRILTIPMSTETHTAPRTPGDPIQSFDTEMFRLQGQLPAGDPDFDLLRITAGNNFGMPSPGHTTLTQLPGGNWAVDSFFDITYRIDFVGHNGGHLGGMSGSTTGTIRMQTTAPFKCRGGCATVGTNCSETVTQNADGTLSVCCDCNTPPPACQPTPDGTACEPVTCPGADEKCNALAYLCDATGCHVTGCDCSSQAICHPEMPAGATVPVCVPTNGCTDPVPPQHKCVPKRSQVAGGTLFECTCIPVPTTPTGDPTGIQKNRYLTAVFGSVAEAARGTSMSAVRVKMISLMHPDPANLPQYPPPNFTAFEGQARWVGPPSLYTENETPFNQFLGASLVCDPYFQNWAGLGTIQIFAADIVPSSSYDIQTVDISCPDLSDESCYSAALNVGTGRFGDVAAAFQLPSPSQLTQPNIYDVSVVVDKFKGIAGAILVARGDLNPAIPNQKVNIADIANVIDGFKSLAYPFGGPCSCPSSATCPALDACGRCHP